jgi:hypothetical protein
MSNNNENISELVEILSDTKELTDDPKEILWKLINKLYLLEDTSLEEEASEWNESGIILLKKLRQAATRENKSLAVDAVDDLLDYIV